MDLADHQRRLLGLIRSSYQVTAADEIYFQNVSESRHLKETRRNVYLWRVYVLERTCALSFNLLKQRDLLEPSLNAFIKQHNISPFRETQGPAFLESLLDNQDGLVACVAQFELAMMKARAGEGGSTTVLWKTDPVPVLASLARNKFLSVNGEAGDYETTISRDLPSLFETRRL